MRVALCEVAHSMSTAKRNSREVVRTPIDAHRCCKPREIILPDSLRTARIGLIVQGFRVALLSWQIVAGQYGCEQISAG